MNAAISPQKILRTGDIVINKETNKQGVLHYVCDQDGQYCFENYVEQISSVVFYDGNNMIELNINSITLPRRK